MNLPRTKKHGKPLLWIGYLIGMLLLVVATITIYIGTRSNEWWRDLLTARLSQTIGRGVEIEGEFRLDLGRIITTEAASVRINNPDWTGTREMLRIGSLLLEFDLLSALGDTLLIHRLELTDIELALEENQDGKKNWEFAARTRPPRTRETGEVITLPVQIEQFSLQRAQFSLSQPRRERPLVLQLDALTGGRNPDDEAVFDGSGRLGELPFTLKGSFGAISSALNAGPVSSQPSGKLGELRLHADISAGGYQVTAEGDITTKDQVRARLKVTGSGPDLSMITRLANTIQLPAWPFQVRGQVDISGEGIKIINASGMAGEHKLAADGSIAFSRKGPVRLDVKGSGPSLQAVLQGLGYDVIPAPAEYEVEAEVEFADKHIVVTARHARLGPANISATLTIPDFKIPTTLMLDIRDLTTTDVSSSLALSGIKIDLSQIMPARLSGQLKRSKGATELSKILGTIGTASVKADGMIGDSPEYKNTDLTFDISGPNLEHFVSHPVDQSIPFRISGRVLQDRGDTRFRELQIKLANIEARLDGKVGSWEGIKGTELNVSVQGPNLDAVAAILNQPLPEGAVRFEGHIRGTEDAFHIDRIYAELGRNNLSGDLKLIRGEPPLLKGRLSSSYLNFALLQRKVQPDQSWNMQPADNKTGDTATTRDTSDALDTYDGFFLLKKEKMMLFPDTPIKLKAFDLLDLDINIRIDELTNFSKRGVLQDLNAQVLLRGGDLSVTDFSGRGPFGSKVNGNMSIKHDIDITRFDVDITGEQLRLGLATAPGQETATYPPTDIMVRLTGAGSTWRRLAASLDGRIKVVQGEGRVNNNSVRLLLSDIFYELFNALNPAAKAAATTRLDCGVYIINLEDGIAEIQAVVIQTDKLTIVSSGTIDLNTERIDLYFITQPRRGAGISVSAITNDSIKLGGTLVRPAVELDPARAAVAAGAAVATGGLSFVFRGAWDRYLSSRDPCGSALERDAELQSLSGEAGQTERGPDGKSKKALY